MFAWRSATRDAEDRASRAASGAGARGGIRTRNLRFTKAAHYRCATLARSDSRGVVADRRANSLAAGSPRVNPARGSALLQRLGLGPSGSAVELRDQLRARGGVHLGAAEGA